MYCELIYRWAIYYLNIYIWLGLAHLCEFIEDCEHTSLTVRILHLLGKEGPRTKQPSRYFYKNLINNNIGI